MYQHWSFVSRRWHRFDLFSVDHQAWSGWVWECWFSLTFVFALSFGCVVLGERCRGVCAWGQEGKAEGKPPFTRMYLGDSGHRYEDVD